MSIRILPREQLRERLGGENAPHDRTLDRWIRAGEFPAPVRLGPASLGWVESEIDEWLEAKAAARVILAEAAE